MENTLFSGVLPDPRNDHTKFLNRHVGKLQDFATCRALVLLGDPGAGKSCELEAEVVRRRTAGEYVEHLLLRDFLTAGELRDVIQDADARWRAAGSPGDLTLALDGFDEPLFAVISLAAVLERSLGQLDRSRLRVLITSRRSVWQERLTGAFGRWWPDAGATCKLVLAPLAERDILQAAATELDAPEGFVASLRASGVMPLAGSPITLRLLLAARLKQGMPPERHRIYALGVQGLVEESNAARVERSQDDPPMDQRLAAARRLAAVGLLAGRPRVVRRFKTSQSEAVLALDKVDDTHEGLIALQAVFDSALLTDSGEGRQWTHRSIQEFLTAQQCAVLPLAGVRSLLADPAHPDRVLPQLAGTAMWLAALRPDVAEWLVDTEPEVLVQADLQDFPESVRARVAEKVVAKLASAPMPGIRSGYAGLLHPGLASQLESLLKSGEPAWRQQEAALMIQATGLRDLDGPLVDLMEQLVTGKGREDYDDHVRAAEWAGRALRGTEDPAVLERVKRLVGDDSAPWPVRGELLAVLWPRHVDMAWLLQTITEADRMPHTPMGRRFVTMLTSHATVGACGIEDLDAWAASLPSAAHHDLTVRRMLSRSAWASVTTSAIGSDAWRAGGRLLHTQWAVSGALHGVSPDEVAGLDPRRRRQLVMDLVQQTGSGHTVATRLHDAGLLRAEDLGWWLEDLRGADAQQATSVPAFFAVYALAEAVDGEDAARVVAAAEAARPRWEALAERFTVSRAERAVPVQLAARDCESWSADRVLEEAQFASVVAGLQHRVEGAGTSGPVPAWPALTAAQRHAAAERAVSFLSSGPDTADEVNAGLIEDACRLITAVDAAWLDRVPAGHWLAWLPGLWELPGGYAVLSQALKRAAAHDEDSALGFLVRKMHQDAPAVAFHQRHLKNRELSSRALARLSEGDYPVNALASLLDIAAAALPAPTAELAHILLQANTPTSQGQAADDSARRDTAVAAGGCLAAFAMSPDQFDGLMAVFEGDHTLARDIIYQAHRDAPGAWSALTAPQRGRLYLWAHHALPRQLVASGRAVRSDPTEEFPSEILRPLLAASSSTHAAILEELADQTGSVWLRADAERMRDTIRAQQWRQPTVAEVVEVLTEPSRRIITSGEQLAWVTAEVLEDIGEDLRADRALRAQLWHRQRKNNQWAGYVPAEEREVSTWLARETQRRLNDRAAVLREVEINPRLGDTPGDIPDLLVEARTTSGQFLTVPGEVKCGWHDEVVIAIRDQLGHRYLKGPMGSAGVYVAVYFGGKAWADGDSRRTKSARHTLEQLHEHLRQHAKALATHGITTHVCVLDASLDDEAHTAEP
ncbi:hypothetical protein ACWGQT_00960 [Streptomyces yangpuensis]